MKKIKRKTEDLYDEMWVFPTFDNISVIARWIIGTVSLIFFGTLVKVSSQPENLFSTLGELAKSWIPLSATLLIIFGLGHRHLKKINIIWSWITWIVATVVVSFLTSTIFHDNSLFITWSYLVCNLFRDMFFMLLLLYFFDGEHRRGSISWAKTKIDNLQARMQPHFLFNTLNSIAEMAYDNNPEELEEAILDLSDLTRAMIGHKTIVSTKEEVKIAKAYIKLQKIRFEDRLNVKWNWKIDDELEIPSLLLQPLIENAIKYGIEPTSKKRDIIILGWSDEKNIYIEISNPFDSDHKIKKGNGITLANLKERLKWLYNSKQYCATEISDGNFTVQVSLPKKIFTDK